MFIRQIDISISVIKKTNLFIRKIKGHLKGDINISIYLRGVMVI